MTTRDAGKRSVTSSTTPDIEIQDLVTLYPEWDPHLNETPLNIAYDLFMRGEYRRLVTTEKEDPPEPGHFYNHQKQLRLFMKDNDRMIVIDRAGTGKTCSVAAVSELFKHAKKAYKEGQPDKPTITRAIIIVKNDILIEEWKVQIMCKCTRDEYVTERDTSHGTNVTTQGIKNSTTRELNREGFYEIKTYGQISKELASKTPEEVRKEYSDSLIVIDEAHNLSPPTNKKKNASDLSAETDRLQRSSLGVGSDDNTEKSGKKRGKKSYDSSYNEIYKLLHNIDRSKIILLTATPMITHVREIKNLMDLILPNESPFPDSIDWDNPRLEDLQKYFVGIVSYVREMDTGVYETYPGSVDIGPQVIETPLLRQEEDLEEITIVPEQPLDERAPILPIFPCPMSDEHYRVYSSIPRSPFHGDRRQAANFIFPKLSDSGGFVTQDRTVHNEDGTVTQVKEIQYHTGTKGYKASVINANNFEQMDFKPEIRNLIDPLKVGGEVNAARNLGILSGKALRICHEIKNSSGVWFINSDYVEAGANPLAFCIGAFLGYERFTGTENVFTNSRGTISLCPSNDETKRITGMLPRKRYALLTSETPPKIRSMIFAIMTSMDNMHGEYIEGLIGSPTSAEGINISNGVKFIKLEAGWSRQDDYQAKSRIKRATSHIALIKENGGRPIPLSMYYCASTYTSPDGEHGSIIDAQIYAYAYRESKKIKRMERIMKQCSYNCYLNYLRNVRPTDVDFTETCDYQSCNYVCAGGEVYDPELSGTNYDYIEEDIITITEIIRQILRTRDLFTARDIQIAGNQYDNRLVLVVLAEIIEQNIMFTGRLGERMVLKEQGGYFFLQKDGEPSIANIEYVSHLYVPYGESVGDSFKDLISRFEEQIIQAYNGIDGDLLAPLHDFIWSVHEPIEDIKRWDFETTKRQTRGRPREKPITANIAPIKLIDNGFAIPTTKGSISTGFIAPNIRGELVYFHDMFSITPRTQDAGAVQNYMKADSRYPIRIFKPSEGTFRDAQGGEILTYNYMMQVKIRRDVAIFEEKSAVWGMESYSTPTVEALREPTRWIRNRLTEKQRAQSEKAGSSIHFGKNLTSFTISELSNILTYLKMGIPQATTEQLRNYVWSILESYNLIYRFHRQEQSFPRW